MAKKRKPGIPVTPSSGNVFADLGFAEPEKELAKAELASQIRLAAIRRSRAAAAVSEIQRRSVERGTDAITSAEIDAEIAVVRKTPKSS